MTAYRIHSLRVDDRDERTNAALPPPERTAYVLLVVGKSQRFTRIDLTRAELHNLAAQALAALRNLDGLT